MKPYLLAESNWKTIKEENFNLVILPSGATEAHNYHLPYATDNIQAERIAEEAARIAWQKGAKIYQTDDVKQNIGFKLKKERLSLGYSFGDIADMTDFSKSTIVNLEKGIATNLDYYIGYAKAIDFKLSKLFDVSIEYKPKYELSEDKKNRVFLSRRIRKLIIESDLFKEKLL